MKASVRSDSIKIGVIVASSEYCEFKSLSGQTKKTTKLFFFCNHVSHAAKNKRNVESSSGGVQDREIFRHPSLKLQSLTRLVESDNDWNLTHISSNPKNRNWLIYLVRKKLVCLESDRVEEHVYIWGVVSVSKHYKNPTKRVGREQSGLHSHWKLNSSRHDIAESYG